MTNVSEQQYNVTAIQLLVKGKEALMQAGCSLPEFTSRGLDPTLAGLLCILCQGLLYFFGLYAQRIQGSCI